MLNKPPLCACGCGKKVEKSKRIKSRWNKYIKGHQCVSRILSKESREKISKSRSKYTGEKSPMWKGGRRITSSGYIEVLYPEHHRARGKYVLEHILVVEKKLGRRLEKNECTHHIDGNKTNNDPQNLQVLTISDHTKMHPKKRAGKYLKCPICKGSFYVKESHVNIRTTCSVKCAGVLFSKYYTQKPINHKISIEEKLEVIASVQ